MALTSEQYYDPSNSSNWGNFQYVTLEQLVNDYMMSREDDDFTSMTPRFRVLYQAMRSFRELYYDVAQEIKGIKLTLSPSLQITLPPDYVQYVRISWVDDYGRLHVMAEDRKMDIAQDYLQDSEYNLTFDDDGCVLIGSGLPLPLSNPSADSDSGCYTMDFYDNGGYQPNRDMSRVFVNGKYRIDKNAGIIQFASDTEGKEVVLEYISDGLFTGCEGRPENEIRIHKFAESAVRDFIYYELIKNRKNVPSFEKARARKEFGNSRRVAKMKIQPLRKEEILQVMRGESKVIK